jgi:hypothetical protein
LNHSKLAYRIYVILIANKEFFKKVYIILLAYLSLFESSTKSTIHFLLARPISFIFLFLHPNKKDTDSAVPYLFNYLHGLVTSFPVGQNIPLTLLIPETLNLCRSIRNGCNILHSIRAYNKDKLFILNDQLLVAGEEKLKYFELNNSRLLCS